MKRTIQIYFTTAVIEALAFAGEVMARDLRSGVQDVGTYLDGVGSAAVKVAPLIPGVCYLAGARNKAMEYASAVGTGIFFVSAGPDMAQAIFRAFR